MKRRTTRRKILSFYGPGGASSAPGAFSADAPDGAGTSPEADTDDAFPTDPLSDMPDDHTGEPVQHSEEQTPRLDGDVSSDTVVDDIAHGVVLPLFIQGGGKRSRRPALLPAGGAGVDGDDLNEMMRLLTALPGTVQQQDLTPKADVSNAGNTLSALNRITGRMAASVSRRLQALSHRRWTVRANPARRVRFSAWSRFHKPIAATMQVVPLDGAALLGADAALIGILAERLLDRGPERSFRERAGGGETDSAQALAAYCLHLFQLDFEWAMAPFFEVETSRVRVSTHDEPVIEFNSRDECVLCTFFISDGEASGRLIFMAPAAMLRPLELLLGSGARVLAPASTDTDDEVFQKLRSLSDEQLRDSLATSPHLLASVVLFQIPEERRVRILQGLDAPLQEELVRRMGRRASMLRALSQEQRMVARTLIMGEGYAAQVLRMSTPEAAARFLGVAAGLPSLFPSQAAELCGEENAGLTCGSALIVDKGLVSRLLMRSFSPDVFPVVSRLLAQQGRVVPLQALYRCDPSEIAARIALELYGVGALMLRSLLRHSPVAAAQVFARVPEEDRAPLLERVMLPRSVDGDVLHVVEAALCRHLPLVCQGGEVEQSAASSAPPEEYGQEHREVEETESESAEFIVQRAGENGLARHGAGAWSEPSDACLLLGGLNPQERQRLLGVMQERALRIPPDCCI